MKKLYPLTILFILTININTAQENVELGLKAGLNYSSFINNNDRSIPADYKGKAGFHAGGFVNFRLTEKLYIRPEVLFSQQGSEFEIDPEDTNVNDPEDPIFISDGISGKIKESVILVPVMAGVFVTDKLDVELGPQLAWVVNRDVTYENNPYPLALIRNDDSGDFEFGVNAGLGYHFGAHYRIGLRYTYGITERQNLHSSVFQLGLYYTL
ncbi:porin family protein [Sinomicrobium sp. M5D2P9]